MRLGEYEILKSLGDGAFGEVFLGLKVGAAGFQRKVAVKKLRESVAKDPDLVKSFELEAQICSFLHHPNVIQVFDFAQTDEGYLLVMEYLDGWELSRIVKSFRREGRILPVATSVEIARQLCDGLHCVHTAEGDDKHPLGLVHRDVKPANLMVTRDGLIKLMDFGVARADLARTLTGNNVLKGTLQYMSPEQARGEPIDAKTDQYATGLLLAGMIVGQTIYRGRSNHLVAQKAMNADLGDTLKVVEERAPQVAPILAKALSRDLNKRYPNQHLMSRDLSRAYLQLPKGPPLSAIIRGLMDKRSDVIERFGIVVDPSRIANAAPPSKADPSSAPAPPLTYEAPPTVNAMELPTRALTPPPIAEGPDDTTARPSAPVASTPPAPQDPSTSGQSDPSYGSAATLMSTEYGSRSLILPKEKSSPWPLIVVALLVIGGGFLMLPYLETGKSTPESAQRAMGDAPLPQRALTQVKGEGDDGLQEAGPGVKAEGGDGPQEASQGREGLAGDTPGNSPQIPPPQALPPKGAAPGSQGKALASDGKAAATKAPGTAPAQGSPVAPSTGGSTSKNRPKVPAKAEAPAPKKPSSPQAQGAQLAPAPVAVVPSPTDQADNGPASKEPPKVASSGTPIPIKLAKAPGVDASAPGRLLIRSLPASEVLLNGKNVTNQVRSQGMSLPPGKHTLTLRTFGDDNAPPAEATVSVTLKGGHQSTYFYRFAEDSLNLFSSRPLTNAPGGSTP